MSKLDQIIAEPHLVRMWWFNSPFENHKLCKKYWHLLRQFSLNLNEFNKKKKSNKHRFKIKNFKFLINLSSTCLQYRVMYGIASMSKWSPWTCSHIQRSYVWRNFLFPPCRRGWSCACWPKKKSHAAIKLFLEHYGIWYRLIEITCCLHSLLAISAQKTRFLCRDSKHH